MNSNNLWSFDQPRNCATVTSRRVMQGGEPITHVYHNEEDDGWQFYSATGSGLADAMVVCLEEIVQLDQTVLEVADLAPGWLAERTSVGAAWIRKLQYADAARIFVDWSLIRSEEDFYNTVLPQCKSPGWHGRNLDALADSWVTGGIDQAGPPYAFEFVNEESTPPELILFRDKVLRLRDESIDENGGRCIRP